MLMMKLPENARVALIAGHAIAMIALGWGLFFLRATMTNLFYTVFGSVLSLLLVADSLLFIAVSDWIYAAGIGRQVSMFRFLLFLSTAAAASGIIIALDPESSVRVLSYFIAAYAFLLSIGRIGLARRWECTRRQRFLVYLLGLSGLVFSVLLILSARRDERTILSVIASYSLFTGLQTLLSLFLVRNRADRLHPFDQASGA